MYKEQCFTLSNRRIRNPHMLPQMSDAAEATMMEAYIYYHSG